MKAKLQLEVRAIGRVGTLLAEFANGAAGLEQARASATRVHEQLMALSCGELIALRDASMAARVLADLEVDHRGGIAQVAEDAVQDGELVDFDA